MFISNKDMEILCKYSKANMKDRKSNDSLLCDKPRCANYADIISYESHCIGQDITSLKSDLDDVIDVFGTKYCTHINDSRYLPPLIHSWCERLIEPPSLTVRRKQWHPTPVFWPGKSHGWRSLVGCSP